MSNTGIKYQKNNFENSLDKSFILSVEEKMLEYEMSNRMARNEEKNYKFDKSIEEVNPISSNTTRENKLKLMNFLLIVSLLISIFSITVSFFFCFISLRLMANLDKVNESISKIMYLQSTYAEHNEPDLTSSEPLVSSNTVPTYAFEEGISEYTDFGFDSDNSHSEPNKNELISSDSETDLNDQKNQNNLNENYNIEDNVESYCFNGETGDLS